MITCVTRSMNDELYNKMLSLCPDNWKFYKVINSSADGYLDFIFTNKFETKWVLNLDEDCFLIDYNNIYRLIEHLEANQYDYTGIQDGGSIPVRIHNPLVANPFFNLFNVEKIQKIEKTYYNTKYDMEEMKNKYSHLVKFWESEYKFDRYEPFYDQFFWLLEQNLKPFFHKADANDELKYLVIAPILRTIPYYNSPTMIYDNNDKAIAIHTWHSRYYHYLNIKKAINNCYNLAFKQSTIKKDIIKNVNIIDLKK